jgi:hypothetical protein
VDRFRLRAWINAVTLATPLGLGIARATGCARMPGPKGLVLAVGYRAPLPRAAAFTVGNVIIIRDERVLASSEVLAHEAGHATQWAACLGVVGFPILYAGASLWSLVLTGDVASRNIFERRAGLAQGGYRERPVRWRAANDPSSTAQ